MSSFVQPFGVDIEQRQIPAPGAANAQRRAFCLGIVAGLSIACVGAITFCHLEYLPVFGYGHAKFLGSGLVRPHRPPRANSHSPMISVDSFGRHDLQSEPLSSGTTIFGPVMQQNNGLGTSELATGIRQQLASSAPVVQQWPAIPVWPTWGGGRVIPMQPDPVAADPYLLIAHHKHSFNPRDPLRKPFKAFGSALGLPYVDVEGFPEHPHRGIDILTYVLDGSDGFRHTDSLGGSTTYRGGSAQFMRTGKGVLHEEFWETEPDRTTNIELFQIWMNLPGRQKLQRPSIRYIGTDWEMPFPEENVVDSKGLVTKVRTVLDGSLLKDASMGEGDTPSERPPVVIKQAWLQPGAVWTPKVQPGHTALLYVREGSVLTVLKGDVGEVKARSTALFERYERRFEAGDVGVGDIGSVMNPSDSAVTDVLLLTGEPLQEPVAFGGPIVMNTQQELMVAYQQLRDGTFLT